MKRILLPLVAGGILSLGLNAADAQPQSRATGTASVKHPIEFVEMNLTVQSECFKTEEETLVENNRIVVSLMESLQAHLGEERSDVNDIFTRAGEASSFQRSRYLDNNTVVECKNTWQQTTTVKFRFNNLAKASEIINAAHKAAAALSTNNVDSEDPVTKVSWSTADGGVCEQTQKQMELDAEAAATDAANMTFMSRLDPCGIKIDDVTFAAICDPGAPSYHHDRGPSYARSNMLDSESSPVVETNFEEVSVGATVTVFYNIPPTKFTACKAYQTKNK